LRVACKALKFENALKDESEVLNAANERFNYFNANCLNYFFYHRVCCVAVYFFSAKNITKERDASRAFQRPF